MKFSIDEVMEKLSQAQARFVGGGMSTPAFKDYATSLGYTWYDLQRIVQTLVPVITPLRNRIPRVPGNGGLATHWNAITAFDTAKVAPGVSEGHRNAFAQPSLQAYTATYKTLGHEAKVTEQARQANGQLIPQIDAAAVRNLIWNTMIDEEFVLLCGNSGLALGITPTPVGAAVTGGSIAAGTYYVFCVALTPWGLANTSVAGGCPGQTTRTNADASTDSINGGNAQVSAASAGVVLSSGTQTIGASVAVVKGAVAYAWYVGTAASGAGSQLAAVTTINSVLLSSTAGWGTQAANDPKVAADYSTDSLVFDGIISLALQSTGLFSSQATGSNGVGTPLTASNGSINEIDTDFASFWDGFKLSPTEILVSRQESVNIQNKLIAAGGAPLIRFVMDVTKGKEGGNNGITLGAVVGQYFNKIGMGGKGMEIPIRLHPNVPAGTIVYLTEEVPYPGVTENVLQIRERRGYRQINWPVTTQRQDYGVYVDEALEMHVPFAFGVRTNIANG